MKKKISAPTGAKCTSTYSGYACVVTGDHVTHTSEKRAGQYVTWESLGNGKCHVAFHQGKNVNHTTEDEPTPPAGLPEVAAVDTQPEAVTTEPTPGYSHEPTPAPGAIRTNERGQAERWCWGLVGGWGWREYAGKGKGCQGCGRHKVDCLCKRMPATPPASDSTPAYTAPEQRPLERIGEFEIHPAAALFPMISDADYPAFRLDIEMNGLRQPIVRIGQLILDGRNRLRACLEIRLEPHFRDFGSEPNDGTDPIAFVVSENVHRRHLDETQRAHVGAALVPMYEAAAAARRGRKDLPPNSAECGEAVEFAARAVNVGKTSVKAAIAVARDAAPEVVAASKAGRLKVSAAADLAKRPESEQRAIMKKIGDGEIRSGKVRSYINQEKKRAVVRKINEQRVAPMPAGKFGVIYGDYPWHYDNSDQHEGSRGHLGYPTMTIEQVVAHALEAAKRAANDCIIALWSTNLYVTRMDRVIEAYGATPRTVFTWPKPKFGVGSWGRGQTEHLIIASIGEPSHTLNEVSTLLPSWKPARPGEHSSKPAEVAALLQKHCGGPFLELFGREPRESWTVWGAESDKFASEAA